MAVYTEVFDDDLIDFLDQYEIGHLVALKGIAEGVENSNYLLLTDQAPFILTLYERRVNVGDLPYFLNLLRHVARDGLPCPQPVAGRDGKALRHLNAKPAAIFTFLNGAWVRRPGVPHCGQVGVALAHLHESGLSFDGCRPNALSLAGWRDLFDEIGDGAERFEAGLTEALARELDYLEDQWPVDLPTGVIHADLFTDNVFFLDGKLSGLIDFYFACNDFFAYDIGICLNAWCFENEREFNVTKSHHMLSGYNRERPLTPEEKAALPTLARGAAMRFLLTRVYDALNTPSGALVTPKDPLEYVRKLRFHQSVKSADDYGVPR